jgi:hypothetical protein
VGGYSIVSADFNGDGKLDLATETGDSISILLNNGDGTFAPPFQVALLPGLPHSLAVGDFNGDGKLDLAVAFDPNSGSTGGEVAVLLNEGHGTFATPAIYAVGGWVNSVAVADFNGDGKPDIAVPKSGPGLPWDDGFVSILLNNGDGTFTPSSTYAVGGTPDTIVAADLNGDGKPDLATADWGSSTTSVLISNGNGTFSSAASYPTMAYPNSIIAADLNGDGKLDLVTEGQGGILGVRINNGDGSFGPANNLDPGAPGVVAAADLNSDGHPDLVVATDQTTGFFGTVELPVLEVFRNNGDGTFGPASTFSAGPSWDAGSQFDPNTFGPASVVASDFNGDGRTDIAISNPFYSGDVRVLISITAQQQIALTSSLVNALVTACALNSGNGNALTTKLASASSSLNAGDTIGGINQLNAFINQITAFEKTGKLTTDQAGPLIDGINRAITMLNTSGARLLDDSAAGNSISGDTEPATNTEQLVTGAVGVYLDNADGTPVSADEQARFDDAIAMLDSTFGPYGVDLVDVGVGDTADAVVQVVIAATSAAGSAADSVLGCTVAGQITLLTGWNWFTGTDPSAIGPDQYDFETIVMHELGHAIGLGHSGDTGSVMYPYLAPGQACRVVTTQDLSVLDGGGAGPEPLLAAPWHEASSAAGLGLHADALLGQTKTTLPANELTGSGGFGSALLSSNPVRGLALAALDMRQPLLDLRHPSQSAVGVAEARTLLARDRASHGGYESGVGFEQPPAGPSDLLFEDEKFLLPEGDREVQRLTELLATFGGQRPVSIEHRLPGEKAPTLFDSEAFQLGADSLASHADSGTTPAAQMDLAGWAVALLAIQGLEQAQQHHPCPRHRRGQDSCLR